MEEHSGKDAEKLLQEEIEFYQKEQRQIQNALGKLGGVASHKKERILNILILFVAVLIFLLDVVFKLFNPIYAVELGVLLVSVKIILLINSLSKMNHFSFWILHSIDIRVNDISRKLVSLERSLAEKEKQESQESQEESISK